VTDHSITEADVRDWILDVKTSGKSPHTINLYSRAVRLYLAHCGGNVSRSSLRAWLGSMSELAPASQHSYLSAAKLWIRWLAEEGVLPGDFTGRVRAPKVTVAVVTPLTSRDVSALLKAAQGHLRDDAILRVLMSSGMRISECAGILTANLDLDRQVALIYGKGGRWRTAPFDDKAAQAVARYIRRDRRESPLADDPHLWLGQSGPLTATGIDRMLRRTARRAGVEGVHAHRLRHGFANDWLAAGGSEQALMSIAGWSNRAMLDRYSKSGASDRAITEYQRIRKG
jgi:integrase/recombinase XerD